MGKIGDMDKKGVYFRPTTAQQRKLLFETWEATGSVTQACLKARVSRMSFYYWKPRFNEKGYPGLDENKSHAPKKLPWIGKEIEEQVIAMHQAHPDWGKKRIEQELAKANNWVPVISPNTVRRVLKDANLWTSSLEEKKGRGPKR
jgi:transposase